MVLLVSAPSVRGMTATIRGAPSTPLNNRVAEMRVFRFFSCACFALFFLLRRACAAAALEAGVPFGDWRGTRPYVDRFENQERGREHSLVHEGMLALEILETSVLTFCGIL